VLGACGDDSSGDTGDTTHATANATTTSAAPTGEPTTGDAASTGTTGDASTDQPGTTDNADTTSDTSTGAALHCDNMLTWENFAEAFMLSWCTGCHNSQLPTAQRAGAPCSINFDSHAGAVPFAASIEVRAIDWQMYEGVTPMPPAALVPADELALLREWIECGAPGPDTDEPAPKCPDP
jgi:hypothetical protein